MKEKQDNNSGTAHPAFPNHSRETYVWENASAIAARSQVRARFDWRNTLPSPAADVRPGRAEGSLKDFEFSRPTMELRWQGHADARTTLQASPWFARCPRCWFRLR